MYLCTRCKKECFQHFGSGKFCSRQCANSRERTPEIKEKISKGVRDCTAYTEGRMNPNKGKSRFVDIEKECPVCFSKFNTSTSRVKKFCSSRCANKSPLMGGYRPGSGRSKSGWYKGFYCGSTWELAFLIWCLDHEIPIERCNEKFSYSLEGKQRTYLPDFRINDLYVEIKGFLTNQVQEKTSQFPKKLIILFEEDLQHVFNYVKNVYGNNYFELYENNPHNQKKNNCRVCCNPCKNVYCSRRCSVFGNHIRKEKIVTLLGAAPSSPP